MSSIMNQIYILEGAALIGGLGFMAYKLIDLFNGGPQSVFQVNAGSGEVTNPDGTRNGFFSSLFSTPGARAGLNQYLVDNGRNPTLTDPSPSDPSVPNQSSQLQPQPTSTTSSVPSQPTNPGGSHNWLNDFLPGNATNSHPASRNNFF